MTAEANTRHETSALRAARLAAGLAGAEAGRRTGMSQSKISKIERGFLLPSTDVAALCGVYNISAEDRDDLVALTVGLREEASTKLILARGRRQRSGALVTWRSLLP